MAAANGRLWRTLAAMETPSNPRAGAIADTPNLAPVSSEYRMKVLHGPNPAVAAHILVSLAIKVVGDACDNLLCQAGPRRGLKEGQPLQLVVLVVNDDISGNFRVVSQPFKDFLATRLVWHVWRNVYEGNAMVLGAENTGWIVSPCGRKYDRRPCSFKQLSKPCKQPVINDVWKVARIGCLRAI